jgi:hypothetical protein
LGSQNVLEENEPVFIIRPDDGPIGPKHVAFYVRLMVIVGVLDKRINTVLKHLCEVNKLVPFTSQCHEQKHCQFAFACGGV